LVTEDGSMAEVLNQFLCFIFTREDKDNVPQAQEMEADEMPDICFTIEMVKNKIRKLRTAAAARPNRIMSRVLQEIAGR
jgi:hypothetical protein